MIKVEAVWMAVEPLDRRSGTEAALARVFNHLGLITAPVVKTGWSDAYPAAAHGDAVPMFSSSWAPPW